MVWESSLSLSLPPSLRVAHTIVGELKNTKVFFFLSSTPTTRSKHVYPQFHFSSHPVFPFSHTGLAEIELWSKYGRKEGAKKKKMNVENPDAILLDALSSFAMCKRNNIDVRVA